MPPLDCKHSEELREHVMLVGGEDVRLRIPFALALRQRGFEISVVGTDSPTLFAKHDIEYFDYPLHRGIRPWEDVRAVRRLREIFKAQRPDVVHAFDTKPCVLAPKAAKAEFVPLRVRTVTGMGYVFSSHSPLALALRPVYRALQRRASRAATHTVFQNSDDQKYFLTKNLVSSDRQTLIPGSGIDIRELERHSGSKTEKEALRSQLGLPDGPVITMIARMLRHKGVLEFIQAAAMVRRERPDVNFLLVGPHATEKNESVSIAEIERHRDVVHYLGPRRDVPMLLSLSDICVLPSYYREGVPRVLLEAGALCVPLVATEMPGCRDVVQDKVNGFLVPARKVRPLATAIVDLVADPAKRAEMGRAAREHVEAQFTLDAVVEAYAKIYRSESVSRKQERSRKAA